MTYLVKQLVGEFAKPLVIAALISAVAVVLRLSGRRHPATWLWASAALIVYLGAIPPVGDALLGPLEHRYPPLQDGSVPAVAYIAVLGGGYAPRGGIPVTGALDEDGLTRIAEGVRVARHLGAARLVVSGGAPPGKTPSAIGYAKLAHDLGIDDARLVVLSGSLDTAAEAHSIAALIGAAPFILVTSAYHMPRAMRLMERAGTRPIPAPTGHLVNESAYSGWGKLLPTAGGLRETDLALHEYLGLAALAAGVDR